MKKITLLALTAMLSILCFTATAQTPNNTDRVVGWSADIDTLLSLIQKEHYVYRNHPLPQELIAASKSLKTRIAVLSDEQVLFELERLMYYVHDGHSYILPVAKMVHTFFLPLQFYIFSDGVFIIDADEPNKHLIGSKVISIGGTSVTKLVEDMNGYVHQDNPFTVKWFAPSFLRFRTIHESYGKVKEATAVTIEMEATGGKKFSEQISYIPVVNFRGIPKLISSKTAGAIPPPLYLSNVEDNYWDTILQKNNVVYSQFNQVENKPGETIATYALHLDSLLKSEKPHLLIIDVRHNNGGNLTLLPPLTTAISQFEKSNTKSKIVVITGRNTFSAAQVFISILNKETAAYFAGEPSSSSPNFVGEDNFIMLPWSGAMGSISNKYHETIPGDTRKWIAPDFSVSLSSAQYFRNQDPVLEFILKKFR